MAYDHHDVLALQIVVAAGKDWQGDLWKGWSDLTKDLGTAFDDKVLDPAKLQVLGVTTLYWSITGDNLNKDALMDGVAAMIPTGNVRVTSTEFGPLWRYNGADLRAFACSLDISQSLWLSATPRSSESWINRHFINPGPDGPSDFAVVDLARHKINYEWVASLRQKKDMRRERESLESRVRAMLEDQSAVVPHEEFQGRKGTEFQHQLALVGGDLANYRFSIGLLRTFRRAIEINRDNYLLGAARLISYREEDKLEKAIDPEPTAALSLEGLHEDKIFLTDLRDFGAYCRQLSADIDYGEAFLGRMTASQWAASDLLQIAGLRSLGETAHHVSIDSAAVVASLFAVIGVELILKDNTHNASS
jgi:hypothetical protein